MANSQPSDTIAAAVIEGLFPPATTTATTTSIGVVGVSGPLPTVWVTDQASISLFNRGPITSVFNPPASCVSTGTWGGGASLYFGHWVGFYYDSACYPSSTTDRVDAAWGQYFCQSLISTCKF
jgi:hypothetical protein